MPVNRNALIRYRTIDACLRNRQRRWTLEDLIDACSEALYEYEGIDKGVSRRSIQMDIQMMRSDKLGYNAPIIVLEKRFYTYEDPDYSITNVPLTDQDLGKLTEVVHILRQFKGFNHFREISGMVQRLENKIHAAKSNQEPVIDFEKNENLRGLEHIDELYKAIVGQRAVQLAYQSFKARSANDFHFHPYYLKEYRNRWFVIGVKNRKAPMLTLALDRILNVSPCEVSYVPKGRFDLATYLHDVIGVTVNAGTQPEKVLLFADRETSPYISTKPLHHSQQIEEVLPYGTVFSLHVQLNFELEREILGFGDRVKVIAPEKLKRRIKETLGRALDLYQFEFSAVAVQNTRARLQAKGFSILHHIYGKKELNQMRNLIYQYFREKNIENPTHAIRGLFREVPALASLCFNHNLRHLLHKISPGLLLVKAIYFDKTPDANWYVTWHQDITINVEKKIETSGFTGWTHKQGVISVCPPEEYLRDIITVRVHLDDADENNGALKVIPGSHNKKLTDEDITLISQNSIPHVCEVSAGGVHIMRPLLLHASSKASTQKHRRVVHLEFTARELPNGLSYSERLETQ